jgi:hypothetical protein
MIEIIDITEVESGDLILIEGFEYDNQICIVTVDKVDGGLIVPLEMGGLDYSPENPDAIIRIGNSKTTPVLTPLAQNMHIAFSKAWQEKLKI